MKTLKGIFVATFIAFACPIFLSAQTVTDIDGNVYNTVTIGTQVWMVENLKVTHFRNGDSIPLIIDSTEFGSTWSNLTTSAYCAYNNDFSFVDAYGYYYNWYAVSDSRNIAPYGWHIPNHSEWQILCDYLGGHTVAGGKLKESDTVHWLTNSGATNESGFTGLPGGYAVVNTNPHYQMNGYYGSWWSSTEYNATDGEYNFLCHYNNELGLNCHDNKNFGYNVRCVKDVESGINDNGGNYDVRIYPNPATDLVTINLNFDQKTDTRIELFDVVGQRLELISDFGGNEDQITFNVGELPHGLYLIKVTDREGRIVSKRLMK